MKTILLPVSGVSSGDTARNTALAVARQFCSHIQALYIRPLPPIVAGEGITVPGDYMARVAEESLESAEAAKRSFMDYMATQDTTVVDRVDEHVDRVTVGWTTVEGVESQMVSDHGRAFDIIVIDRERQPSEADWRAACEAALFDSGRPVLIAGFNASESSAGDADSNRTQAYPNIGARVLIAWNGSPESARAIALSMPFLLNAKEVQILTVKGATVAGPNAHAIQAMLARHGIRSICTEKASGNAGAGQCIVDFATNMQADLIVKGAFTQSRLRQLIFGGATSYLLTQSPVPVLFAH